MFRSIKKYLDRDSGFADVDEMHAFNQTQRTLYQEQLPNIVRVASKGVKDSLKNVGAALATTNPVTRTTSDSGVDIHTYAASMGLPDGPYEKMRACETASIDQLITNQNPYDNVRCAWIYEKGPSGTAPKVSRGVLGTSAGPLNFTGVNVATGNYYWDPLEAQKAMARDRCAELVTCTNVETSDYSGKCAFDPIKGRGIPIFPNGQVMFPNDPSLSANPANLITKRGSCPPVNPNVAQYQASRDVCSPLSNGTLSRDCILQQVRTAGCDDAGALAQALRTGGDLNDYTKNLRQTQPYTIYQQRSTIPLVESVLRDGSASKETALLNFRSLAKESAKSTLTGLQAAARDLCVKAGNLDTFDFCAELMDTTPPPYELKCLQAEWGKRGGLRTGLKYPSSNTIGMWNGIQTWGLVMREMDRISADARDRSYEGFTERSNVRPNLSTTKEGFASPAEEKRQRAALRDLIGIEREPGPPKQIPAMAGVEIFWINLTNNTFMGRVLSLSPPVIDTGDNIPIVNKSDSVQLIMMTNVRLQENNRLRIGAITDDGISLRLNKNYQPINQISLYRPELTKRTADEMTEYYLQGSTTHLNDACWDFKKGGPNIIVADWYENNGWARFEMFTSPCDNPSQKANIPTNSYTLTQEGDAPFLAFEYTENGLRERRLPALFESPHTGSAFIDQEKKAVRLERNGAITLRKSMLANSWRSMTIHWTTYAKPTDRQILCSYGSLFEIYFQGGKTYVKFSGPSLTKTVEWDTNYTAGLDFIFYVNMRSSFEGGIPDIITFGVQQREWYAGGNWTGGFELRMPNNQPIYNMTDSHVFTIGSVGGVSTDVGIKAVRFFDYELDASDLSRDASNKWVRQWIGEKIE